MPSIRYSLLAIRQLSSHRLEVCIPFLVEFLVGVAHGFGLGASDHDLEIDRLEAVVLIAVDDTGGTRDALPGTEPGGEAPAALVLDEHVEIALQHEEALLDLVGVRGVALARLHGHDRQGEVLRRNDGRVAVLAGAAGADEPVLRALVAFDLGVLERRPIRLLLAKAPDVFLHDFFDRNIDQFRRARMACNAHGLLLWNGIVGWAERMLAPRASSTTRGWRRATCASSMSARRSARFCGFCSNKVLTTYRAYATYRISSLI